MEVLRHISETKEEMFKKVYYLNILCRKSNFNLKNPTTFLKYCLNEIKENKSILRCKIKMNDSKKKYLIFCNEDSKTFFKVTRDWIIDQSKDLTDPISSYFLTKEIKNNGWDEGTFKLLNYAEYLKESSLLNNSESILEKDIELKTISEEQVEHFISYSRDTNQRGIRVAGAREVKDTKLEFIFGVLQLFNFDCSKNDYAPRNSSSENDNDLAYLETSIYNELWKNYLSEAPGIKEKINEKKNHLSQIFKSKLWTRVKKDKMKELLSCCGIKEEELKFHELRVVTSYNDGSTGMNFNFWCSKLKYLREFWIQQLKNYYQSNFNALSSNGDINSVIDFQVLKKKVVSIGGSSKKKKKKLYEEII